MIRPLLLALAAATPAFADAFGDVGGCARHAGAAPPTDMAVLYDGAAIHLWEARCAVTGATQAGAGGVFLDTVCTGEGETWPMRWLLTTPADPDKLTLRATDPADAPRHRLRRCR